MKTIHFCHPTRKFVNFEEALCFLDDHDLEVTFGAKPLTIRIEADRVEAFAKTLIENGIVLGRDFFIS